MLHTGWGSSTGPASKARFSPVCLLTLGICAFIHSGNVYAATWRQAQVGDYRIISSMSQRTTARVARHIQTYQTALRIVFPKGDPHPHVPVTILLLDAGTWDGLFGDPYRQSYLISAAGVTFSGDDHIYMLVDGDNWEDAARITYHEMTHAFLHKNFNSHALPVFLDEGYAELMSTLDFTDAAIKVGRPVASRYYSLRQERWVPLEELLTASRTSAAYASEQQVLAFYAQSWLVVHYMAFTNPARRKQIDAYINEIAIGKEPQAALTDIFKGDSLKIFNDELVAYAKRKGFEYWTLPTDELAKLPSVQITEMPWREAGDEISNWLVRRTKYSPSQVKFLKKRYSDQTDNGLAAVHLARAYLHTERADEAAVLLTKFCTDRLPPSLSYQCGEALMTLSERAKPGNTSAEVSDTDQHSKYLMAAVRQQPDNLTYLLRAADAATLSPEDTQLVTAGLMRAHQRDRFNFSVAYELATIYRDVDLQKSRYFAEHAAYCAPSPDSLKESRELLKELDARATGTAPATPSD